jgi:two-component system, OmpR family, phosphate regulon sensor histidine kinase PhoR
LKPVRTKQAWKFGLLYLVLWFLFLLAVDLALSRTLNLSFTPNAVGAVSTIRLVLWLSCSALFLLFAVPALLQTRRVARRIRQLKNYSIEMTEGNFRPLPKDQQDDELADLGQALSDVADQYDRTIRLMTEERNRSDTILRSMVEGVAVIEPGQKIVFCNEAFCRALGLTGVPCAGRLLVEVTRQSGLLQLVEQALEQRETLSGETEMNTTPPKTFAVTAAPVQTATTTNVVLVLHDITELRKFKTPLTAIQGFAETLLAGALDDEKNSHRFLQIIRDHAVRLGRLTNDLLKLSSIEAGKLVMDMRQVVVADLIQACIDTLRLRAEQKQLSLTAEYPNDLPTIRGDASRLREALLNLLENALQYTPAGGQVVIGSCVAESELIIAVSDTGMGIPEEDLHRIFERFYRVDDARSREVGGTGLGLSITKHLIEAHGGRIEVKSEVGRGTTFSLVLPVSADSPA